ncbi:uncharacterized protein LOC119897549 [Micropterus salmoides]|uniref:uncharacterized protein LOC119897549 n=1 Tax=Micropterus salmoides TaxID=27706 RepID=UPI0018EC02DE|nr:uncharacterized protein LOC119897549 [Micropterus salmoides]
MFGMTQEAELLYRTVQWDESLLQSAGKTAAGLLFSIKCPEDAVCQLHLPHCETKDALLPDGLLSVVHITDDGMSILEPLEITDTHVVVKVPHLSAFGLVWDIVKRLWTTSVYGQVLLFLGPPNPRTERKILNVLLLPSNIHLEEVSKQQQPYKNIKTASKCKLIKDESYTLVCPEAIKIQPTEEDFDLDFGPNYHPTYEIFLPTNAEEVNLTVQDQRETEVWKREVDLTGDYKTQSTDHEHGQHFVDRHRTALINRVSDTAAILDNLMEKGLISSENYEAVRAKQTTHDQMRDILKFLPTARGKDALYKILKEMRNMKALLDELEGSG